MASLIINLLMATWSFIYKRSFNTMLKDIRSSIWLWAFRSTRSTFSISPVAIKVNWEFVASHKYLQGYRIWHKKSSSPSETYVSIPVMHSEATSFVINRLEEHTEYDILVQPFYKSVIGRPAAIMTKILTHQDVPSMAPQISKARLYNASTLLHIIL